jgi:hypothetical protein
LGEISLKANFRPNFYCENKCKYLGLVDRIRICVGLGLGLGSGLGLGGLEVWFEIKAVFRVMIRVNNNVRFMVGF